MSSISGGFQIALYVLRPFWVFTVFDAGPEFCQQSEIYNGLLTEKHFCHFHGITKNGNIKRKSRVQKLANCNLRCLPGKLDVNGRHSMLSYLSSLPSSVLRSLHTEAIK